MPKIEITKPFLPDLAEIQPYLERIWKTSKLTNGGLIHQEFEHALAEYLGVKYISLYANGTLALIMALKVLDLRGEVITTPFTWVATAQAIKWNNLTPVFVDVEGENFNIDPQKISEAISSRTTAILPVHVFGNPCNTEMIGQISCKYKLRVLYDAAHGFGIRVNGEPLCNFGDLSVLSFHATKIFSTCEGGAVVCHDLKTKLKLDALKNNGLTSSGTLVGQGLNAKMNELQAAFGLAQLKYVDLMIEQRKQSTLKYQDQLEGIRGISMLKTKENIKPNYSYLPVVIESEEFRGTRDDLLKFLLSRNIFARAYFHPLVTDFQQFSHFKAINLETADLISKKILCLPLFYNISDNEIERVVNSIIDFQKAQHNLKV